MTEQRHDTVPASALRPGDRVTETTTPHGPWYRVTVDPARRVVVDDGTGPVVEITVAAWSDPVLRLVD